MSLSAWIRIHDPSQKSLVKETINKTGKTLIELSPQQVQSFAGNMLQVGVPGKRPLLAMSQSAKGSLDELQLALLERESEILAIPVPTIEKYGGGSIRCMLAEVFIEPRSAPSD